MVMWFRSRGALCWVSMLGLLSCARGIDLGLQGAGGTLAGGVGTTGSGLGGAQGSIAGGGSAGAGGQSGSETTAGSGGQGTAGSMVAGGSGGVAGSGGSDGQGGAAGTGGASRDASAGSGNQGGSAGQGGGAEAGEAAADRAGGGGVGGAIQDASADPDGASGSPDGTGGAPADVISEPACTSCGLRVQYQSRQDGATVLQTESTLKVFNTGTNPIDLTTITMRYWYTIDNPAVQLAICEFATLGCPSIGFNFTTVAPARPNANEYIEVGFIGGGTLAPGADSGEIQFGMHDSADVQTYIQTNDYSFQSTGAVFVDAPSITAYVNGVLAWGVEP